MTPSYPIADRPAGRAGLRGRSGRGFPPPGRSRPAPWDRAGWRRGGQVVFLRPARIRAVDRSRRAQPSCGHTGLTRIPRAVRTPHPAPSPALARGPAAGGLNEWSGVAVLPSASTSTLKTKRRRHRCLGPRQPISAVRAPGPAPRHGGCSGHRPRSGHQPTSDPDRRLGQTVAGCIRTTACLSRGRPPISACCASERRDRRDSTLVSADNLLPSRDRAVQRPISPALALPETITSRPPRLTLGRPGRDDPQADLRRGCRSFLNVTYAPWMIDAGMENRRPEDRTVRFARGARPRRFAAGTRGPGLAADQLEAGGISC